MTTVTESTEQAVIDGGLAFLAAVHSNGALGPDIRSEAARAHAELDRVSKEQRLRLAVLGETSAGKSTFINALLGIDLLASDLEPTTSVPTRLTYGPAFQVVVDREGARQSLCPRTSAGPATVRAAMDALRGAAEPLLDANGGLLHDRRQAVVEFIRKTTTEAAGATQVKEVTIRLPSPYLAAAIDVIDTPGFNPGLDEAAQQRHLAATRQTIETSHLALFLIDARNPLKSTEQKFLRQFGPYLSRIFFVANKMDLLDDEEAADTEDYLRTELASKFGIPPAEVTLYFVSSLTRAPESPYAQALAALRKHVVSFMQRSRAAIVLERTARTLARQSERLHANASALAAEYRDTLEVLRAKRIADPEEMARSVLEAAETAYRDAIAAASAEFAACVPQRHQETLTGFRSRIQVVTARDAVEKVAENDGLALFESTFTGPLQELLVRHVAGAVTAALDASMRSFSTLYDAVNAVQPQPPTEDQVWRVAQDVVSYRLSAKDLTAAVVAARKKGDNARQWSATGLRVAGRAMGGIPGAIAGAALGYAIGSLFGPSLDELKAKALAAFEQELDLAAQQVADAAASCFTGKSLPVEALVSRTIHRQVDALVAEVERLIQAHEATKQRVEELVTTLDAASTHAAHWASQAGGVSKKVHGALARAADDAAPELSPLLDAAALTELAADAAAAVVAGGTGVPRALAQLVATGRLAPGTTVTREHHDTIKAAAATATLAFAVAAGNEAAARWCANNPKELERLGLTPVDVALLLPGIAGDSELGATLIRASRADADDAELAARVGKGVKRSELRDALAAAEARLAFWQAHVKVDLEAGFQRLDGILARRGRRAWMLRAAAVVAAAAAVTAVACLRGHP